MSSVIANALIGGGSMPFPQNLRRLRLARFLSQAELARQSGLHTLTISRLEAGRARPSTRTVRALASSLAVMPSELATPEEVAEADKVRPSLKVDGKTL
jgi:transcriptional regulator with XRE-family HTH domain